MNRSLLMFLLGVIAAALCALVGMYGQREAFRYQAYEKGVAYYWSDLKTGEIRWYWWDEGPFGGHKP